MKSTAIFEEKKSACIIDSYLGELKKDSSSALPNNQDWPIILMESLGFRSDRNGICFGTSCSAIEFMMTGEIQIFNQFFYLFYYIYKNSSERARKSLDNEYNNEFKTIDTQEKRIEFYVDLVKKEVKDFFETLPKKIQIEINAFFNSIELYHQAFLYPHLFPKYKLTPRNQSILLAAPLVLYSKLEKLGGIQGIRSFHGYNYCLNELHKFFERLQLILDKKLTELNSSKPAIGSVTLQIINPNIKKYHAIAVG
jgi:hypothetical protein